MEVYIPGIAYVTRWKDSDGTDPQTTPGTVQFAPGAEYELSLCVDSTDSDLASAVDALRNAPAVVSLQISAGTITHEGVKSLAQMPWLRHLSWYRCTDDDLAVICRLTALQSLDLETANITDRGLARIADLPDLRKLSVANCRISDDGVKHLRRLRTLEELSLFGCDGVTDRGIAGLAELPQLRSLELSYCWRLTARALDSIRAMRALKYVGLSRPASFTLRLLRKFGIVGNTIFGSFNEAALKSLVDSRPDCEVSLAVDQWFIQKMIDEAEAAAARGK